MKLRADELGMVGVLSGKLSKFSLGLTALVAKGSLAN
jgi:hypothetical protein